jgi:hypothetical protein
MYYDVCRFQFRAIFSIIEKYGWSYVSVIYDEGSYGENGFKQLSALLQEHGLCLGAIRKIPIVGFSQDNVNTLHKNYTTNISKKGISLLTNAF